MEPKRNGSNFYQLSAQVLNDKNLNHAEKLTMAILNGLADEEGKCWPSNEWLCDKLNISEKPLQVILKNLEKNNYIKRKVFSWANNPFKKYRIIFVQKDFKLFLPDVENDALEGVENDASDTSKTTGIIDKKERIDKKEIKSAPPPPSADASDLFEIFYKKIKERSPGFKEPKKEKWLTEFDKILRIDKRDLEECKSLILWAAENSFWKANCLSPESLRKHYDKMIMQMGSAAESSRIEGNRSFSLHMKRKYPEQLKNLTINQKYAMNLAVGKEVPFSLPEETFRNAFFHMFGGRYEPNRGTEPSSEMGDDE
jgi:DNA-binding Lrp family transcriptional regulator